MPDGDFVKESQLNDVQDHSGTTAASTSPLCLPVIAGDASTTGGVDGGSTGKMYFDTLSETVKVYYNGQWWSLDVV